MNPRILLIILLLSCNHAAKRNVTPAFYYWKQTWTGNTAELKYMQDLPARRLYVKLFDVDIDEVTKAPTPVAIFRQKAPFPAGVEIVPVVFLMNEIWANPTPQLAANVSRLMEQLCDSLPATSIKEIQLDCDWTQTSRDAYFSFIKQIRQTPFFRERRVSATIRMYQVKYKVRTGIPPVDRGLLMCYNMGDLRKPGSHNSILDISAMESYLGEQRVAAYPLPLDIALPLFSWSVLFRNGTEYTGILRNIGTEELQDTTIFAAGSKQLYIIRKDTTLNGYPLKEGSVIRRETIDQQALETAAQLVAKQLQTPDPVIIFYHLDSTTLKKYPLNELQKICRFFN
ncbi:hypothetical protein [Chitinophaga ginsengisegetis]|uniref:hypothetical protein n=1 Tax=Chitinophaga ginsengisegetis TaxID=393003 RepID=UPI000DB93673|nr:hypothetical protein [Chitinophaga ginsengisegetis]MDR6566823.1 hypothetical protein [Chitinophaga ginsengisegetis]MDR6646553.1 hypothetical protein [Chitinophaga ginsengisegetis]MDR6652903.1 hypothetical protein [Chitinophaga ginsengisegetis]